MDSLIEVNDLWKKYSRNLKASLRYAARDLLASSVGAHSVEEKLRESEFWALRNINFSVQRGEVLGIMGHNGAGKSTLLKCIANKIKYDRGSVDIRGELAHLIEMSAGFSPTMSGRANVKVRGQLLGKRGKQLKQYIDEVAEFADIGEFFDSPVQFYSSGMKSRLGFAASSVINPDILILDEVLAVGDLPFRIKCYERINELAKKTAVLFVSHSPGQVARLCDRAIYIEKGRQVYEGDPQGAIALYQDKLEKAGQSKTKGVLNPEMVSLIFKANNQQCDPGKKISYGDELTLEIDISRIPPDSQLRVILRSTASGAIADWNSVRSQLQWPDSATKLVVELGYAELNPGSYSLSLQVMSPNGREHICLSEHLPFRVGGELMYGIAMQKRANWIFV